MPIGIHWSQLLILIVLALLVFGPKRLPEMGAAVAKTIKEFQKTMRDVTEPGETLSSPAKPPEALVPPADAALPPAQSANTASASLPQSVAAGATQSAQDAVGASPVADEERQT
jgi:sec-independent protein translocase protein TatA